MKKYHFFIIICIVFILNGCALVPSANVNELNIIEIAGFDLTKNNLLKGSVVFPVFRPSGETKFGMSAASGETIKKIRERLDSQMRYRLMSGQLRVAIFSLDLAKKGFFPIIDTFNRDPAIGNLMQLAIVDGQSNDLLSLKQYQNENLALYLYDLLKHNSETGPFPYTDFSTFMYQYFEVGQDPYLPVLKVVNDKIDLTGIALFKRDKLVTIVPWKYAFIFKSMMEDYKQGLHQFKIDGEYVAIDNLVSKNKLDIKIKKGKPEFTIHLNMNARIQEYTGDKPIVFPKHIKQISKAIKKDIEKNAQEIISILQKNNVDPIGLGSKLEAHQRDFDWKKWRKQYPSAKINVKVKLDILHTGIVE
ncbi:Ger(x)C family spore germination protein [Gottfriedia acidiceleris]|uniref:Ger(X)C family spore germination protein n=1 Tax=Gottfriedia acidiceleris TaxID=371036 RepID=A0ABY4JR36_9BACI|nr:Ger(x)C family spore germination protein [Gottfriedia acidiceleris]UPM55555.1 Ger(x)C family spore germination protein [Gottfriedia acidiceleris]